MDYLFENLGDERFQEFCSCIVSKEFPNTQVFPVGQPDGGRDSLVYIMSTVKKEFLVFQVKFVRRPDQVQDLHKWLTDIIKKEVDKIAKLIPKGARKYYLITNVRGTAHLDTGSKDKVNAILEENISIPSICWWREDLVTLFEKDPLFKWSFPEVLNGQDILNSALFDNINENKEKRERVIKAYLIDQYAIDNKVKFRQIDLENYLLDLFTDVPIKIKQYNKKDKSLRQIIDNFEFYQHKFSVEEIKFLEDKKNIGAAEFLLNSQVQTLIERILLEAGPGQGKSTIAQYICQVHRARLLDKSCDLQSIPEKLRKVPVRLPFKIDLRHIAAWVEKRNPYQETLSEEYFTNNWSKSLESFLIAHLFYHSQIGNFTLNDFITICKLSPVLFVFDGFDEIANIKVREEVIELINKGINRISENAQSVQVLITSRPAAFSDSIGFSVDTYPHFELTDVTPAITNEYVEKWIKASKLDNREASGIRRLVEEKLKMPHLRDLAKSPMQLAIFLSLLKTRGESLPNKRTALYDSYIELFFNRESEKNVIIRDYRDLIIDIHQYLAWILHSEAELYKNSGTIHIDDLKKRLNEYLLKEGHRTDITDKLFKAVQERVCALVSRVQGTFEFEVQPLREYFCAKYLYKTAPYSPAGAERSGTKPDRFEAISRNFYWQNVVRFFAGCFDKGELPMLIQKIKELQNDTNLKYTNYPRIVTSQLLSDYVFTQYPLYLKDVVKIIVDGINIGNILNQGFRIFSDEPILLPDECGRLEVIEECFSQLKKFPPSDYATELIGLIVNNPYHTIDYWIEYASHIKGEQLSLWLEYAYHLEIIHKIPETFLIRIIKDEPSESKKRLQTLIMGNRLDIINKHPEFKKIVFRGVLDGDFLMYSRRLAGNSLQFLSAILHPILLSLASNNDEMSVSFIDYIIRRLGYYHQNKEPRQFEIKDKIDQRINDYKGLIEEALNTEISAWRTTITPWDAIVENGRFLFKDCWSLNLVSVISAGIKAKDEKYEDYDTLDDSKVSLCKRTRCARMKSGNINYWERQLQESGQLKFKLLVFYTWATPKTIDKLLPLLAEKVERLSTDEFITLSESLRKISRISTFNKGQQRFIENIIKTKNVPNSIKYLISFRFTDDSRQRFIYEHIDNYSGALQNVLDLKLEFTVKKFIANPKDDSILPEIKKVYNKVKRYDRDLYYYHRYRLDDSVKIPLDVAVTIMSDCKSYPRFISSLAERACRLYAHENLVPVGEIAKNEGWFTES